MALFQERSRAESFGAVALQYDRARPSYPPALLDALLDGGVQSVLDVGCGTGIAGALLAERGVEVLGIEIDERMAGIAREKGLEVEVGRFEEWDQGRRRFDLLTSGQAWHWIDPQAGSLAAARALREGGRIALFWNFGDPPPDVLALLAPIYARLVPEIEKFSIVLGNRGRRTDISATGIEASGEFGGVRVERFPWRKAYDTAAWVEHVATHSDHQTLPPEQRERLLGEVGAAIDHLGGSFEMSYETVLVSAARR